MSLSNAELEDVLSRSECLITQNQIEAAYDRLAAQLNLHYQGLDPLVLVIMNGGLIPAGHLFTRLNFFHRMDYIHVSRYKNNIGGDKLEWKKEADEEMIRDQHVLLIDDIYDEGISLYVIVEKIKTYSPKSLKSCVLLDKEHQRKVKDFRADFIGMQVADRYIYGCGMDYHGYLRHLPGIYALKESSSTKAIS